MAKLEQKNNTKGRFVLLYDSIDYQPWSDDPFCMLVAQFLIRKAAYSDYAIEYRGNHLTLKPGQFVTTLLELSEKAKVTAVFERFKSRNPSGSGKSAVKCCMDKLVADGFLSIENIGRGQTSASLITINNWADAQAYSTTQSTPKPNTQTNTQTNTQDNTKANTHEQQEIQGLEGDSNTQSNAQVNTQQTTQPTPQQTTQPNTVKQQEKKNSKSINNTISSPAPEGAEPQVFIELPLNRKDTSHPVTLDDIAQYEELYPIVDIEQSLRNMVGWLNANPQKRKTKSGIEKFINTWLAKNQNQGQTTKAPSSQQASKQPGPARITTNAKVRKLTQQFGGHNHG